MPNLRLAFLVTVLLWTLTIRTHRPVLVLQDRVSRSEPGAHYVQFRMQIPVKTSKAVSRATEALSDGSPTLPAMCNDELSPVTSGLQ